MAQTKTNKPKRKTKQIKQTEQIKLIEPETIAEAKALEKNSYWQTTEDEILLRSPEPR
jgi:SOS response regulatory protein OraA/RecX